jgi:dipeptidyl aminopeptidase/acylaminoacyl peptidase
MTYEHDLVERAVQMLAAEEPSLEGLVRRRDRKRRNQRLAAGAVGLAIGIAVMALGAAFLRAAGDAKTGSWPPPSITATPIVQPGEVLLDPYPSGDNPTYVIAADVATGAQRTVAGCKAGCRLLAPFDASADGGWIAYHLVMCAEGECGPSDPEGGLWVVGAGAPPRLVLATPRVLVGGVDAPWSWSPTGAQLAYADVDELILLDPTTWERTRIATSEGTISTISWGPDGRSIAYSVEPPSPGASGADSFGVFVLRSGGQPRRVSGALGTDELSWSPDGDSLVVDRIESGRSAIEIVATDGSGERVLVEGPMFEGPGAPVWSPDGSRIAFIRTPKAGEGYSLEIWVIGADGRGAIRVGVANAGFWGSGPVWSPDSHLVAWSSTVRGRWVAVDADRGGSAQPIDRLVAERWQQG